MLTFGLNQKAFSSLNLLYSSFYHEVIHQEAVFEAKYIEERVRANQKNSIKGRTDFA